MSSEVVIKDKNHVGKYSRMAISLQQVAGKIDTVPDGLYDQNVTLKAGDVTIDNDSLDLEFDIPFDDDTEANEAEIQIYNLTNKTINALSKKTAISITAGYGKDTGCIFSGYISKRRTVWEDGDKVTTIYAIDNHGKKEADLSKKITFGKGTKASSILRKLVARTGLPVAVFKIRRDYTYKGKTTVDGGLMNNIRKYADVCGVSAYVCKSKIYVCPLTYGQSKTFHLSEDTGLLSISEFEEESTSEKYKDHIVGVECEMLLQHRIQTGSVIQIENGTYKGTYRVREGSHNYDGDKFTTKVKAVSTSSLKK